MSAWKPKRFWTSVTVEPEDGGFTIRLDGRPVRTPAKSPLILPTRQMAEAVAAEWQAQEKEIRPETMPVSRFANSAIDKVRVQFSEVADMLAEYGGTDLLCYRATAPHELADRQAAAWDPLLAWAAGRYLAPLNVTSGVMHIEQPAGSLAALRAALHARDPFRLAALHDLIAITGSLVLGLAIAEGRLSADEGFELSRIDEHWQVGQWGADDEATVNEGLKLAALREAARFSELCG